MAQAGTNKQPLQGDIRIVIIGKTGAGKSETGNSILGKQEFDCSPGGKISTWYCLKKEMIRLEKNIVVIDTPGLQDSKKPNPIIRASIQNSIEMAYPSSRQENPGPNAILLCLKMGRFTAEDESLFQECLVCFGKEMFDFTIVVFTHEDIWADNIKHSGNIPDHEQYRETLPKFASDFIDKCRQTIFFNNRKIGIEMDKQVKLLLKAIENTINRNGGKLYTPEILQQVVNREKMQHIMNYIYRPIIVNSFLAIGNMYLLWRQIRR